MARVLAVVEECSQELAPSGLKVELLKEVRAAWHSFRAESRASTGGRYCIRNNERKWSSCAPRPAGCPMLLLHALRMYSTKMPKEAKGVPRADLNGIGRKNWAPSSNPNRSHHKAAPLLCQYKKG
jgi:hypothetical protein